MGAGACGRGRKALVRRDSRWGRLLLRLCATFSGGVLCAVDLVGRCGGRWVRAVFFVFGGGLSGWRCSVLGVCWPWGGRTLPPWGRGRVCGCFCSCFWGGWVFC